VAAKQRLHTLLHQHAGVLRNAEQLPSTGSTMKSLFLRYDAAKV
jgi:hypothetical protein